ncbi:MAG: Arc family DNA-binding protein [Rikenellaceae bacterium]|nr:Arc family DNA-binding protein [Rikenellaceae bacterium]
MGKEKKSFVLRMDKKLFEAVEKWAEDEFRSTNGQLEWIITAALKKENRFRRISNDSPVPLDKTQDK